jgi:hypothetical protein
VDEGEFYLTEMVMSYDDINVLFSTFIITDEDAQDEDDSFVMELWHN